MKKNIIIVILLIMVLGLGGFIAYDKFIDKDTTTETKEKEAKADEKSETKDIEIDVKGIRGEYLELLDLLQLKSVNSDFLAGLPKGKIENFSQEEKQFIIYKYANLITIDGEDFEPCAAGAGECDGISKDEYERVAKKYNIKDSFADLYKGSNIYKPNGDEYPIATYTYGGFIDEITVKNTNITIETEGEYVVLTDEAEITTTETGKKETRKIKCTFNKLADGTYALYSISY